LKRLLLSAMSLSLISCASYFTKRDCNKTNWFAHGQKVALTGKRVDADSYVKTCEKVGADINYADLDTGFKKGMAQYCTKQGAIDTGRKGMFLNLDLCDTPKHAMLKDAHTQGVRDFCTGDNAYKVGVEGWEYNNICPKDLEAQFMSNYKSGRKEYFRLEIERRQQRISELRRDIRNYERERQRKYYELRAIPPNMRVAEVGIGQRKSRAQIHAEQYNDELQRRRDDTQSDIDRLDRQIRESQSEQKRLSQEIVDVKRKLRALR